MKGELMNEEIYLGDGLCAAFDGYQIRLRAPREIGDHVVYLEPAVYIALREFAAQCWPPPEET